MSKAEIEREIRALPREQALEIQDWLSGCLDDQAGLQPDFVASIERGKADDEDPALIETLKRCVAEIESGAVTGRDAADFERLT
jgi:hypothetical protein